MKLAFIGFGNMANALINGILATDKNILSDDLEFFFINSVTPHLKFAPLSRSPAPAPK